MTTDDLLDESHDEKRLLAKVLLQKEETVPVSSPKKTGKEIRPAVDWLIIIPALVGLFTIFCIAYAFGAMIVGMTFAIAGGASIWGLYSIINTFLNAVFGVGIGILGMLISSYMILRMWTNKNLNFDMIINFINVLLVR